MVSPLASRRTRVPVLLLLAAGVVPGHAGQAAQDTAPASPPADAQAATPTPQPSPAAPSPERGAGDPIPPVETSRGSDVTPSIPVDLDVLPPDFEVQPAASLPEGVFLPRVTGVALPLRDEEYVILPDAGQQSADGPASPAIPPLVVLPSQRLANLALGLGNRGGRARVIVSGQVYAYRGRTYILLASVIFDDAERTEAPTTTTPQQTTPDATHQAPAKPDASTPSGADAPGTDGAAAPGPTPSGMADADVTRVIDELERLGAAPRTLARPEGGVASAPARPVPTGETPLPPPEAERTVIVQRRGRLVRLPGFGGRFAFAQDNDPDSPASPPVLLLPSRALQDIEETAAQHGESLSFVVTGRVTTYRDRNYLLPVFFQATRATDVTPRQ